MTDTTYRTGFGTGTYGVNAFGLDGVFKDGEAIVIGVTTTASGVVRVRLAASFRRHYRALHLPGNGSRRQLQLSFSVNILQCRAC